MRSCFRQLLFIYALAFAPKVLAGTSESINVEDVIRNTFPSKQFTQEQVVSGDLNQDNLEDFAVLLRTPSAKEEGEQELKIAVFLGKSNGGYQFHTVSEDVFPHMRASVEVEIKRKSLFLYRKGAGGCCTHWSETFQFKMRGNELVLIGSEWAEFSSGDEVNDHGISANYLTSEVISWNRTTRKRQEVKKKIPRSEPIKLHSFNYGTYLEFIPKEAHPY